MSKPAPFLARTATAAEAIASAITVNTDEYWSRGYTIVRKVFLPEEIAELKMAFDRTYAEAMTHPSTWRHQNRVIWVQNKPGYGKFISGCQWQAWADETLNRVRTDPRMLAILKPLIGDDLKQSQNQMHWKMPGSGYMFEMHQDVRSRKPAHCFRDLATSYVQTGIAVDRHWAGNGAMTVVPYSNRMGDLTLDETAPGETRGERLVKQKVDMSTAIPVELEEGDVVLWGPYTIHGGGVNSTTDSSRRFYINGYVKADKAERGQPTFDHGTPVPLAIPALIQYDKLYSRPEAHYPDLADKVSHQQRD